MIRVVADQARGRRPTVPPVLPEHPKGVRTMTRVIAGEARGRRLTVRPVPPEHPKGPRIP